MGNLNCPVLVVSLEGSVRRDAVTQHLNACGIPFQFFDAVRGRQGLVEDSDGQGRTFARELSNGEVGCWRSHLGVMQKMVDESIPMAVIFEDDFLIRDPALFVRQLETFKRLQAVIPWDWIKLFQVNKITAFLPIFNDGTVELSVPFKRGFSCMAYAITAQGAYKFLAHSQKELYEPIDRYLDNTHRSKIELLVSDLGSIGESEAMRTSQISERAPELRTRGQKFRDSLEMRLAALKTYLKFRRYKNLNKTV